VRPLPLPPGLAEVFAYNPETGAITYKVDHNGHVAGSAAGRLNNFGYVLLPFKGKSYVAHRVAWLLHTGEDAHLLVDHINGTKTDNRFSNLRLADKSQNGCNRRGTSQWGKGVSKSGCKFKASIKIDGRTIYLGRFPEVVQARDAFRAAAIKYHGEFARFE